VTYYEYDSDYGWNGPQNGICALVQGDVKTCLSQGILANSPDFSDMRLSPIDWPCSKMVRYKFLGAKPYGVIHFGPSKDRKLAKNSVLYEMVGTIKGNWAVF
jgi:hypothetical protein